MRFILILISLTISATAFSQTFPFGTYYYLPKSNKDTVLDIMQVKISAKAYDQEYRDRGLQPRKENFRVVYPIDTIVKKDSFYYFIFKAEGRYTYTVIKPSFINKKRVIQVRAGNSTDSYYSRQQTVNAIPSDTLPFIYMTYFTKEQLLGFSKLKPLDSLNKDRMKFILLRIADARAKEQAIYASLSKEARSKYYINRFYPISFLYFFVEAGLSPFVHGNRFGELKEKFREEYKTDNQLRNLIDDTY